MAQNQSTNRVRQAKTRVMKGDRVKVIRGNFRDSEGTVLRVLPDASRVVVEGVNMRKRHERPTQDNPEGGIITRAMSTIALPAVVLTRLPWRCPRNRARPIRWLSSRVPLRFRRLR